MDRSILVIDLEATCWETKEEKEINKNEIIEIGWCSLDLKTLQSTKQGSIIVKPINSVVSPFCTKLTTLTQEDVDTGVTFEKACTDMQNYLQSKQCIWASYGDWDRIMFEKQCRSFGVPYPFLSHHMNVKDMFMFATGRAKGMAGALSELGLKLVGTHHRGVDDAYNIAQILAVLIKRLRTK